MFSCTYMYVCTNIFVYMIVHSRKSVRHTRRIAFMDVLAGSLEEEGGGGKATHHFVGAIDNDDRLFWC